MKHSTLRFFLTSLVLLLFTLSCLAVPQGKGKGKRRGQSRNNGPIYWPNDHPNSRKKDDRFVNGHDARDGRWDKRGPKRRR
jgi:hypothetical protein